MPENHVAETHTPGAPAAVVTQTMAVGPAADFWSEQYGRRITTHELDEIKTNLLALVRLLRENER